ncbi:2-succinyl-6-hydroxy-2,4-cyclohexadiene-1-carboxylate synthase [Thiocapsa rosea]|uniref:2-succinyl-6-hydroxy-2, 4-cyclohexadiene-1-carboxylate synthase n=1 Tax=Thiocapsa rosea TaxID=69360 RepID=A0A495VGY8_9GAMM|nr:2-succinyl-6-hydroxy-2,4-cyclohexadiene-1-carboxylate synthase [Thiocapsa rosea]
MACCPGLKGRALAIDLPGHGADSAPVRPFQDSIGDILGALPDSVDEVVGYSMGGRFALGLMALDPERFLRATIISAHPGLEDAAQRPDRLTVDRAWIRRLLDDGIDAFVNAWESQPLFATQADLPSAVLERQRLRRLSQRPSGLAASLEHHGLARMPSLWGALTAFPGELTWIVGASDTRFLGIAREVVRRRPATRLHVLPGVGHNPLLECPEILSDLLV